MKTMMLLLFSGAVLLFPTLTSAQYWDAEEVDAPTANVGLFTSIAMDSNNNPHISYYDDTGNYLKYARYDGTLWHLENVDTTANAGQYSSIALDSNNNPHISYYYQNDPTHKYLRYAHYDGSWHTQTVDTGGPAGDTGRHTSIALDSNNNPHISYYDYNHGRVIYAYYDGSWHTQTVDIVGLSSGFGGTSIALDSGNHPHVSYYDYNNQYLRHARYDGALWHKETVDATVANVGQYSSIALDSGNQPHISYRDVSHGYLRYARYDGAAWHLENADTTANVGLYTSIALDGGGNPCISYFDSTNGRLKYARYDGGWQLEIVDMVHDVGRYSSLALDSGNNPNISYYDTTSGNLKYARWVTPMPAPTPTPRYVELSVAGGPDFSAGQTLTLNWQVNSDHYGFSGSPRDVYLGVILSPEGGLEGGTATVSEVLGTGGNLMLFHPAVDGPHAYPPVERAWGNVVFPLSGGNSGSLNFTVPANVGQRCVFVAAFSPFPVPDQCVVSNGFNLPPLSSPPTPVSPSGRSGAFYLPEGYTRGALPLLVAFHGTGGDGAGMVAAFQDLADEYGFIIVAPDSNDPAVWWISEAGSESDDYPIIMEWVNYIRNYPGVTIDDDYVMTLGFSGGAPVAPYMATNDDQFTAFATMHGEVWEPSIGANLALAWLSTGADDWWTPAMFEGYADMLDGKGFPVTLNIYPGGHTISDEEKSAAINWWMQ